MQYLNFSKLLQKQKTLWWECHAAIKEGDASTPATPSEPQTSDLKCWSWRPGD